MAGRGAQVAPEEETRRRLAEATKQEGPGEAPALISNLSVLADGSALAGLHRTLT